MIAYGGWPKVKLLVGLLVAVVIGVGCGGDSSQRSLNNNSEGNDAEVKCGSPLLSSDNSGVFGEPEEEARQYFEAFAKWDSEGEAGSDLEPPAAVALQCHLQGLGYTAFQQDFKSYSQQSVNLSAIGEASGPLESGRYLAIVNSAAGEAEGQLVDVGQALEVDIPDAGLTGKIALIERGTITAQEKARRVEDAGAVAAIIYNDEDDGLFGAGLTNTETLPTIPVLALEGRLGSRLSRILATEDVVVSLGVSYIDTWSINVVAEKSGSEPNDKLVIMWRSLRLCCWPSYRAV